ncbi:glycogen debranching protein [Hymenobacter sp. HSC-4F20]|uniref:alpha-L-rhamnosidase-related protein n=1 Tax=Hymenobacter sp. HSC-4F20 TaxID=2864135 RepID=UPI001C73C498|nr:trehalase family glycosidase [Hymenobacter sp. HSC-4F20]MBX0291515.1 glycogen debranching protein [Hymenobacter sp. HSC-4F20]
MQNTSPAATPFIGSNPIWHADAYTVYPDSVVQGSCIAQAVSSTELTSTYCSPPNAFLSPRISFKFSINGQDNEMPIGQDHVLVALPLPGGQTLETPVIVFGQQFLDETPIPADTYLEPNTRLKIRLDLRPLLASFREQGYYQLYTGQKLYQHDFQRVFVAGSTAPLSWDFASLSQTPELELKDPDGNGIYETTLTLHAPTATPAATRTWKHSLDVSHFPQYSSDYPLLDALYNLSLEEAKRAVEPDGTFRTGQEWAGVWTRDISYSILLAQAALQPEVAKTSLLRKVTPEGRIVQDTGTGGAYPCSTDRMIWAVAAWEVYQATGDEAWLRQVYPIGKKSIEDDVQNAYDPATGLVRGESSFLDWREQTYPAWMQPADIYQSQALGTNAVHYQANAIVAEMAALLGDTATAEQYRQQAQAIRTAINEHLWLPEQGAYGQFRYGRIYPVLSPRSEALGDALSVLFGVAPSSRATSIIARSPLMEYGVPCIYPQISGIPPYHNNAVWPFVQSFWGLAAAQVGNETAFLASIAAVARPAALFLTNKENFVASNGDFSGTQINSSNMLWSLSGTVGLVYKGLFGMRFEPTRLVFAPFVPQALRGTHRLTNFSYRGAVLDIELTGFGNQIDSITLDGQPLPEAYIPATLAGQHQLYITLVNHSPEPAYHVNQVAHHVSPPTPAPQYTAGYLSWPAVPWAATYHILRNGQVTARTTDTSFPILTPTAYTEFQIIAVDSAGFESFASEPLAVEPAPFQMSIELAATLPDLASCYPGSDGKASVEISTTINRTLTIPVTVPHDGVYALDFYYANGNGPISTSNKCAFRTLRLGQQQLGTVVLPQRGEQAWADWGYSNPVVARLPSGHLLLTLSLEEANQNMHGEVNHALLHHLRLTHLE